MRILTLVIAGSVSMLANGTLQAQPASPQNANSTMKQSHSSASPGEWSESSLEASEPRQGADRMAPVPPSASDRERAAALYVDAEASFVADDLSAALRQMQLAYELSRSPELLFNLGMIRRELGDCRGALRDYRQYLEKVRLGVHRAEATRAVAGLEQECPERLARESRTVSVPVAPVARYWTPMKLAGWSAVGAAVVAAGGATYFALKAASDERALEARIETLQASPSEESEGFTRADQERERAGARAANWARVLGVGAAGLTAVGVTLLVLPPPSKETRASELSIGWVGGRLSAVYSSPF